jgi:hypothetical protein
MPKFGALAYTWVGTWNKETGHKAIEKAAQAGLDLLEIPLVNADQFDADLTARILRTDEVGRKSADLRARVR